MGELEAAGDAATGAVIACAVEPATGEADGHTHERSCLNCGAELAGDYCHRCGQKAHVHRTIAAWWHDFLHSVLHLDTKFWRTLPMLAWRPGELTRRYIEGERARFISPLALFLFTVFLMFAVFNFAGGADPTGVRRGLQEEARVLQTQIAELERQRSGAIAQGRDTAATDRKIGELREELSAVQSMSKGGPVPESAIDVSDEMPGWVQAAARKAGRNPELLLYKLQNNAYKFSWALIPISVPFVWLLLLHRRRYREQFTAYDHLVFVTYSIAFMSLLLLLYALLNSAGVVPNLLGVLFMLIPPLHMYRQLRGAYGLSRLSAAWRALALLFFATVALGLFGALLLLLGVLA